MRLFAITVVACGCFHPSPPAGIPCGSNGECPGDQICDIRLSPPTCVEALGGEDGGVLDGADGAPGVDAPPAGACVADSDCDTGACHEMTGACVPEAEALFVAPNGQGSACTRNSPCGSLQTAIEARTTSRYTIALAPGTYSASWDTDDAHAVVSKMIVSGPTRSWDDAVITSTLDNRVNEQITAVFEGVTIRGGAGNGVDTRGDTTLVRVWIDKAGDNGAELRAGELTVLDSRITDAAGNGILAGGGTLVVQRTDVSGNDAYGIHVDGAGYTIANTIITSNGTPLGATGGVRLRTVLGGPGVFRFNTLARNQGSMYPSVSCSGNATIASSIIGETSFIIPVISPQCTATYSLFNTTSTPFGTGNIAGDPLFVSATDFHLQAGSPAIDKANPSGAEPIDFDGQQRLAPPDIGADERL